MAVALTAQKNVASLMRKTVDRQESLARKKFRLKGGQVEKIILHYVKNRNSASYMELLKVLREYPINNKHFKLIIEDCLTALMSLGPEFKQFVELVCKMDWPARSEELVALYGQYTLNMVTAHSYHCPIVLDNLVARLKVAPENWEEHPPAETVSLWSNIHTLIAKIVEVMPMTIDLLMPMLIEQFPYYKAGCVPNRAYVHNLIWMTKYLPFLREHAMTAIITRMVEMDSNIVDRAENEKENELKFETEPDEKDELLPTLDYCMLEMLRWLEDERDPVLPIVCDVFERVVLPTHGIKHVQFLLLYATSISQQCSDRALSRLWATAGAGVDATGGARAPATRRTAAAHLVGLLARAVRVPHTRLIHYLREMSDWCHSYITATQETVSNGSSKVHGAFQAICHAIFYLVALKQDRLFSRKEHIKFIESLNLPRLLTCALNPLRTCPRRVVRAFSAVAQSHRVADCRAIVEADSRVTLNASRVQDADWFPYDRYILPVSGKIISPFCVEHRDWDRDDVETQHSGTKRKLEEDDHFLMILQRLEDLVRAKSRHSRPKIGRRSRSRLSAKMGRASRSQRRDR